MYKIFYALLTIVWLLDIVNFPGFEILDTTYPINFWMWFWIWLLMPRTESINKITINKKDK